MIHNKCAISIIIVPYMHAYPAIYSSVIKHYTDHTHESDSVMPVQVNRS